jgi:hypothetical protein
MSGTIDPGSSIRWVLGFVITIRYDKTLPRRLSQWDMAFMIILLCLLCWWINRHTSCTSWTLYLCHSWTSLLWFSLMTFLFIQRVWKNMKSIFESCFNDCETTSFIQSLASVSFGSMKWHSWVTWYHLKESWRTPVRWGMCWIGIHQSLFTKCEAFLVWRAIIKGSF